MTSSSSSVTLGEEQRKRKCTEDFFYDEPGLPWIPLLPVHTFEQRSSCKVIIISQMILGSSNPGYYYCKLHPEIYSHNLDTLEYHYQYKQPEKHKSKILEILNGGSSSK